MTRNFGLSFLSKGSIIFYRGGGEGAPGIWGNTRILEIKRENRRIFGTLRGEGGQKNFTDPTENQSGAWYAEAVDRAVIRKLKKLKHCRVLKNSADGGQGQICNG